MGAVLLLGTPLQPHAVPNVLLSSPASPSLSLLVLGLGASAEEPHWLPVLPQEQVRTPAASARAEISVMLNSCGVCCGIVCVLLRASPCWANPEAVECFWIEWSLALAVGREAHRCEQRTPSLTPPFGPQPVAGSTGSLCSCCYYSTTYGAAVPPTSAPSCVPPCFTKPLSSPESHNQKTPPFRATR